MRNRFLLILLLSLICNLSNAQKKVTLSYFKNDTLNLELNLFSPEGVKSKKLPLVIYVHGGGFSSGERPAGDTLCMFLSKNGYLAATITYTLYMKNKSFGCDGVVSEKIRAMQYGANDLWLATSFFIENADKYQVDISKIFIAGSSAGAETALHAAFWDLRIMNMYNATLPPAFKYAGMVAGSGAIMDLNLITDQNKIPIMMFHGNADDTVPYATAAHRSCKTNASGWLLLSGSFAIYNHLLSLNSVSHLYTFCGGGHEYSGQLFYKDPKPVLEFLNDVMAGKKFQKHTIIPTGKINTHSAQYKFCD
jgi:poly(3-hydroxybutyrate) depolymerase